MAENDRQNRMIEYLLHNSQPDSLDKKFQPIHGKSLLDIDCKH